MQFEHSFEQRPACQRPQFVRCPETRSSVTSSRRKESLTQVSMGLQIVLVMTVLSGFFHWWQIKP